MAASIGPAPPRCGTPPPHWSWRSSPPTTTPGTLPFYAAHEVDEILIVDPDQQQVHWLALAGDGRYEPIQCSRLIALGQAELQAAIHWPTGAQS